MKEQIFLIDFMNIPTSIVLTHNKGKKIETLNHRKCNQFSATTYNSTKEKRKKQWEQKQTFCFSSTLSRIREE